MIFEGSSKCEDEPNNNNNKNNDENDGNDDHDKNDDTNLYAISNIFSRVSLGLSFSCLLLLTSLTFRSGY